MAIVEMSKIRLVGMTSARNELLDALSETGCVELSFKNADEGVSQVVCVPEELEEKHASLESAVETLTALLERRKNDKEYAGVKESLGAFVVSCEDFARITEKENELFAVAEEIKRAEEKTAEIKLERVKRVNLCANLTPYVTIKSKFSEFVDTPHVKTFFGTVKSESLKKLTDAVSLEEFSDVKVLAEAGQPVIVAVALKEEADKLSALLTEAGFTACPFKDAVYPEDAALKEEKKILELDAETERLEKEICDKAKYLKELKVLSDRYRFETQKAVSGAKFEHTASTFMLEGFLPKENREKVEKAIYAVSDAVFTEFCEPEEEETVPTLTKNDKLVSQAEFVTDMYSPPDYREVDPNKTVFFFFMLFMGVIMADIGYGLLMIALGSVLSMRIKTPGGAKKLWNVIAIGGVFTIIFGVLFNSFFGFEIMPFSLLPNPAAKPLNMNSIMTILLFCLLLGVIQIATGYFMKALNCFKHKDVLGGIFDGLLWVLFFIGFVGAVFNFLMGYLNVEVSEEVTAFFDKIQKPALIVTLSALALAALTAGRNEKGFGKFSKGFGAIYGLINLMSDILSYARLFGLMISGMIIASTFNDMGLGLIAGGGAGYVLGAVVMVIGHAFNLAMGVLGAYIHDSRLQYIEYFSKFYTGEGEKFTPFGSELKYIYVTK